MIRVTGLDIARKGFFYECRKCPPVSPPMTRHEIIAHLLAIIR